MEEKDLKHRQLLEFYSETSSGQNSNLYLNDLHFFNTIVN
jgi:hypothetical protein